ncbi:dephospho-CoA kinase [Kingella kingae]|uniref:Dephospho-CoA kinase n=7 Tax=Kingella kingae TaxID=504 RepID=F5S8K1_KINKI|nr:dephospho-CoA kinase [Kingella kingae]EGK08064.1 dephospho-CoA kinase [Kingella kingae ATCC 23330]EIC13446.1 kinase [Kingella kingae PYKK081]MBD3614126.1 dephospho-CoA kinase [Kingella kingae]MBD3632444.1 dephospho-CoA kinase [Kingella kingae]MBD3659837.1 dephospho-CoA kinase [Kingella kingae]
MTAWIGLTGGIGSGKSQVAACFALLGVPVIDADKVAKQLTQTPNSTAMQQIAAEFGTQVLDSAGCLDRAAMREIVFADTQARQRLEGILHPLILQDIQIAQAACTNAVYGVIEVPTLIEHPTFQQLVLRILVVGCDEKVRIERVMQRSGLTEAAVRAIMQAQASDSERLQYADDYLDNTSSLHDLRDAVEKLHQKYSQIVVK